MSDNQPSGTLGGMISSLFGRRNDSDTTTGGFTGTHKALTGALLAAGAAYLYKRAQDKKKAVANG